MQGSEQEEGGPQGTGADVSGGGIRVATIDNYQGEENDIMILSLNRVNVLLSRAKHGMYLIGNKHTLMHDDRMWTRVIELLSSRGCVGDGIPIVCQKHPQDMRLCKQPQDFLQLARDGGCSRLCEALLDCGHVCPRSCHPGGHQGFQCRQPCSRRPRGCQFQHSCKKLCFQDCGKCSEVIKDVLLHCGHSNSIRCWQTANPTRQYCKEERLSNLCGHVCGAPCHAFYGSRCGEAKCEEECSLACAHSKCRKPCGVMCKPCMEPCDWACKHVKRCSLLCFAPCDRLPCNKRCDKNLGCGHPCPSVCGEPCEPYQSFCRLCDQTGDVGRLQVDLFTSSSLKDANLEADPLILFPCQQHVLQISSADAHMELHKVYSEDAEGNFVG
ncbi:hypothetical protein GUITHDRAFT_64726, partial [Guillardia theta CCMP2712]